MPKPLLNVIKAQTVRIYASATNIFTLTKYTGYDPEIAGGVDKGLYPQAKTFIIGLNIGL